MMQTASSDLNQWYGNNTGPGKFAQTHGSAVDPKNGDVWIGDREEYRIVVYDANGKFRSQSMVRQQYGTREIRPDSWVSGGSQERRCLDRRPGGISHSRL